MESLKKKRRVDTDELMTTLSKAEDHESTPSSSSTRISSLRSKLMKLSHEYPELNDIKEFSKTLATLKVKEHEYENEEKCPLYKLPQDLFNKCLSFLDKSYGFVAPVSKHFHKSYKLTFNENTETRADFEGLSKEAGVYLVESFPHEISCPSSEYSSVGRYLFGKDSRKNKGSRQVSFSCKDYLMHKAARQGNLDVYKHFLGNGYEVLNAQNEHLPLFQKLGENGHLHLLQYLNKEHHFFQGLCYSAIGAARGGHVDIVKWMHSEVDCFNSENQESFIDTFVKEALEYGQIEILTWIDKNIVYDIHISTEMILDSKNFESVQFFVEKDWFDDWSETDIIATENMDIIKYFVDRGLQMSEESIEVAIGCQNFEILKYLLSIGIEWTDDDGMDLGSILDRFEMMKLRFESDGVWNDGVNIHSCIMTQEKNFHIGMLKYLHEHQCPLVEHGMVNEYADQLLHSLMSLQQIDILKYMHCKMSDVLYFKEGILYSAIQCKWFEGMKYILRNCEGYGLPNLNLILNEFDDIEILQYCQSHSKMKWDIESNDSFYDVILTIAEKKDSDQFLESLIFDKDFEIPVFANLMNVAKWFNHREDILQLLYDRRFPLKDSMREAVQNNVKVVKFLEDKGQKINAGHIQIAIAALAINRCKDDGIEIISYLIKKKCPQNKTLMDFPSI
ncbi:hypothetical protein CTEN210_11919 [Chaetoceros tenuissimus]|uniref:Ankyrin repeat protein n=1 Tax=Chaetoceros tenuissimus TaxID=426638 RepID=A0AAD3HA03_9STRA|nr:hypothetical protein CTEN210_11919 [Chaetoceros tenuissimus]